MFEICDQLFADFFLFSLFGLILKDNSMPEEVTFDTHFLLTQTDPANPVSPVAPTRVDGRTDILGWGLCSCRIPTFSLDIPHASALHILWGLGEGMSEVRLSTPGEADIRSLAFHRSAVTLAFLSGTGRCLRLWLRFQSGPQYLLQLWRAPCPTTHGLQAVFKAHRGAPVQAWESLGLWVLWKRIP